MLVALGTEVDWVEGHTARAPLQGLNQLWRERGKTDDVCSQETRAMGVVQAHRRDGLCRGFGDEFMDVVRLVGVFVRHTHAVRVEGRHRDVSHLKEERKFQNQAVHQAWIL